MYNKKLSKTATLALLTTAILLTGCNSNSKKTKVTPPTFTPIYSIPLDKVDDYVDDFKQNSLRNQLTLDGKTYPLISGSPEINDNYILSKFSAGWLIIPFDFKQNEPLAGLRILMGDPKQGLEDISLYQEYISKEKATIEEQEDDYVYNAVFMDPTGNYQYDIKLTYNESLIEAGSSEFSYQEDMVIITGDLGTNTYVQMENMINNHPEIKTLALHNISGSVNDDINMFTGRLVRKAGLSTWVPKGSVIASGGVDLFASGITRKVEEGATVAVHSWCCSDDGKAANQLSKEDKAHGAQLTYFREMLGTKLGPNFYWFTLDKANFDATIEEMQMSPQELQQYLLKD